VARGDEAVLQPVVGSERDPAVGHDLHHPRRMGPRVRVQR
jgi:hypothetical protein